MDLAFSDNRRGVGENLQDLQRAVLDHELERTAEQKISDQNAGFVAKDRVRRRLAAPEIRFIDDVVMQERGGVDELDTGGERDVALALVTAQSRGNQQQQRPYALATRRDDMPRKLRDQRHVALHIVDDDLVDLLEVVPHQVLKRTQCLLGPLGPGLDSRGTHAIHLNLTPRDGAASIRTVLANGQDSARQCRCFAIRSCPVHTAMSAPWFRSKTPMVEVLATT